MKSFLFIFITVLCSGFAQLSLKAGSAHIHSGTWQAWIFNIYLWAGLIFYFVSFYMSVRLYTIFPLSLLSPLMAGAIFIVVFIGSIFFFAEQITFYKIIGCLFILIGIWCLSQSTT